MKNLLLAAMLFCTNIAIAQGTIEDYRRAYSAGEKFSANKVFYSNVNPEWIGKTHYFWYVYNPQIQISAESETKRSIFREKDKTKRSKKESAQHSKSRNKSFVMTSVSAL